MLIKRSYGKIADCGDCDNIIFRDNLPIHSQNYCKLTNKKVRVTDKACEKFKIGRYIVGWVKE